MFRKVSGEFLLLEVALVCLFILTHSGYDTSEARFQYSVAQQIVRHGELGFDQPRDGIYSVAPNGRTYSSHEFGNVLFLIPVAVVNEAIERRLTPVLGVSRVGLLTQWLFAVMGAVLCATGAAFLYLALRIVFCQSICAAVSGTLVFSFCSFYWTYSRSIFDGVLSCVLLSGGMLSLFVYRRKCNRVILATAFAFFGFGLITRLSMLLPIIAAVIYLLSLARERPGRLLRDGIVAAVTLTPFACWQAYYNYIRTGNPLTSPVQGPQYASNNALTGDLLTGIAGILFSPGKSIFIYLPITALSLIVMHRFWRKHNHEAVFVAVTGMLWLLLHARLQSWYGAWGWGPRHFVTIAPVVALPFLVMRGEIQTRWSRWLAVSVLLFGFLLGTASIVGNWQYRLSLARQERRDNDRVFVWDPGRNQAVDALTSAVRQVHRTVYGGPLEIAQGYSAANVEASNTINLWLATAYRQGVPAAYLAAVAVSLSGCAGLCIWLLCRRPEQRLLCK